MSTARRFVYVLRSDTEPARHYVGLTSDVARRLLWHNAGPSGVTVHHRPWSLVVSIEFADPATAWRFERYLKSGSGRAFAKRHFTRHAIAAALAFAATPTSTNAPTTSVAAPAAPQECDSFEVAGSKQVPPPPR